MDCPTPDTFNQLVGDLLAPPARATLVDHAGSCASCRALLGELLGFATLETQSAETGIAGAAPNQVDRYSIEREIGAGAMGVVYAGRDPSLDRAVAIKLLRGAGSAARLTREAQMLAKLHHPNVVAVYDVGEHEGHTFVAMALVDGDNLRTWLRTPRDAELVVRVIRDAGRGLAAAHAAGLIHRDLKPDNIFVAHDGSVLVGDFGLARNEIDRDASGSPIGPIDLTRTGMVLGTPAYMAPEHALGEPTAASDQFSLCVTAWESLYGERPFGGETYAEVQHAIERGAIKKPPERDVPARVRLAIERGLSADPSKRFPSVAAFVAALAPPRPLWPWVAAFGVTAAMIVTIVIAMRPHADLATTCAETAHELDDLSDALAGSAARPAGEILDSYRGDWIALRHDVCMSPRANDPRIHCLDRARDALAGFLERLPTIDPDNVHGLSLDLPRIGECKSIREPSSPTAMIASDLLLARIAIAVNRVELIHTDGSELAALATEAHDLDDEPAIIAVALGQAQTFARLGQADAAEEILHRALAVAEGRHDDHSVAAIAAQLANIEVRNNKLDQAATMIPLAVATLARSGGDDEIEMTIADDRALLASAKGDHHAAIEIVNTLIPTLAKRRGAHSMEVLTLETMLAREYVADGNITAAAVLDAKVDALIDPVDVGTTMPLVRKVEGAFLAGDATRTIELATQYVATAHKLNDPALEVDAETDLAQAFELGRDFRAAAAHYRAALVLLDHLPNDIAESRGSALEGLGNALLELGQIRDAIVPLREAVAIDTKAGGVLDSMRVSATIGLAHALSNVGQAHEARLLLEPLLREVVADEGSPPARRAGVEFRLAQALWDDGGAQDRARSRVLANDAARDYGLAAEKVKTAPLAFQNAVARRLDELHAWRKQHP